MQWMAKASGAEAHKFMTEKHAKARPPRVADNEYDYEDYVESLKPPPPTQAFKDYMNSYLSGETDPSLLDEPMEEETEVAGVDSARERVLELLDAELSEDEPAIRRRAGRRLGADEGAPDEVEA